MNKARAAFESHSSFGGPATCQSTPSTPTRPSRSSTCSQASPRSSACRAGICRALAWTASTWRQCCSGNLPRCTARTRTRCSGTTITSWGFCSASTSTISRRAASRHSQSGACTTSTLTPRSQMTSGGTPITLQPATRYRPSARRTCRRSIRRTHQPVLPPMAPPCYHPRVLQRPLPQFHRPLQAQQRRRRPAHRRRAHPCRRLNCRPRRARQRHRQLRRAHPGRQCHQPRCRRCRVQRLGPRVLR